MWRGCRCLWTNNYTGYNNPYFSQLQMQYLPLSQQPAVYNDGFKANLLNAGVGQNGIVGQDVEVRTGFSVSSLRYAFAIQKWMETNMQVGVDYHEWLLGHYGVSPSDSVLQHPEYLGGTSSSIITSEVFQQSSTDEVSPQGSLAGVGFGNTTNGNERIRFSINRYCCNY